MKVSIIALTYNHLERTTKPFVESLIKCFDPALEQEYIFIDNASADQTPQYLSSLGTTVIRPKVVLNKENLGFPGGNNQGIKMAGGDIIILINNDTLVTPGWLRKLADAFEYDGRIGLVGPVTNSCGNIQRIYVDSTSPLDQQIRQGHEWASLCSGDYFEIDMLGFFCVAIKRKVFDDIGLLDEGYGRGMFEDDDFSLRAHRAGYVSVCIEDLFIYHMGSASFNDLKQESSRLFFKNKAIFENKHGVSWTPHNEVCNYVKQIEAYLSSNNTKYSKYKSTNKLKLISEFHPVADRIEMVKLSDWASDLNFKNSQLLNVVEFAVDRFWNVVSKTQAVEESRSYKLLCIIKALVRASWFDKAILLIGIWLKIISKPFGFNRPLPPRSSDLRPVTLMAQDGILVLQKKLTDLGYRKSAQVQDQPDMPKSRFHDILVYPIMEWESRWQRPQQILSRFALKGHRLFVFSVTTKGVATEFPSDDLIIKNMTVRELDKNLFWIQLCSFKPLSAYADEIVSPADIRILNQSMRIVRERFAIGIHLGVVHLPFWAPLALDVSGSKIVYDCMDYHAGFSTNSGRMLQYENTLIERSELVIVSSNDLDKKIVSPKRKLLLRNGCEYDYFSKVVPPSSEVVKYARPLIGYYGAISEWFDVELVFKLAKATPQWQYVLIGNTFGADVAPLKKLENVVLLGEKPYRELTGYLSVFDVCLIPFKLTPLTLATNPIKFYEYSAAGKPTVATRLPELESFGDLVTLADDAEGFQRAIESLLHEDGKNNRSKKLQLFAHSNTWDQRFSVLESAIRRYLLPHVSIVVLSFNNIDLTRRCIESILNHTTYPCFDVIIVDNASTDGTREYLETIQDPRVRIQINQVNLGFAGGNRVGCRMAEGEIVVLLNNDTLCPPAWLEKLVAPFLKDERVGLVGPMTNFAGNEQCLDSYPGDIMIDRVISRRVVSPEIRADWLAEFYSLRHGQSCETDRLGFFCVAIRKEAYDQIGDIDEGYKVGMFEDDDYCIRMKKAGWKIIIAQDAFVYHHGNASFKKLGPKTYNRIWKDNRSRYETKWGMKWVPPHAESVFQLVKSTKELQDAIKTTGRPTVLMPPTIDWSFTQQRPQQMAKAWARAGYQVFYLTLNHTSDKYYGFRQIGPGLCVVEAALDNTGVSEWVEMLRPVKFDLLFAPWATNVAFMENIRSHVKVYDYLDEVVLLKDNCPDVELFHEKMCHLADMITVSSERLISSIPDECRKKSLFVPNAVELDHFQRGKPLFPPGDLLPILKSGGPVIGYCGALTKWIDWEIINSCAEYNASWQFVFMGPDHEETVSSQKVFTRPNVHWLGVKSYGVLPDYYAYFDVGIIPFLVNDITLSVSPIKMFEYLAAGIPVIAPALPECVRMKNLLVARSESDWKKAIEQSLSDGSKGRSIRRQEVAGESWQARVELIMNSFKIRQP